jgi:hypothetical protein
MNVRLTNVNNLGHYHDDLSDVVFLVEATKNEAFQLWQNWSSDSLSNITPISDEVMSIIDRSLFERIYYKRIKRLNDEVKRFQHTRVNWVQIATGFCLTIGYVNHGNEKLPVSIEFSFARINGKKVAFYSNYSRAGDSQMIENFLAENFQLTHDNYTRWNQVNATNFHNCVGSLDNLDEKPRNLSVTDHNTERAIVTNWYPGIKFETGEILTKIFGDAPFNKNMSKDWRYWNQAFDTWIFAESLEDATANYRKLNWWENRNEGDYPKYVRYDGDIYLVEAFNIEKFNSLGCEVKDGNKIRFAPYSETFPATKDEFLNKVNI